MLLVWHQYRYTVKQRLYKQTDLTSVLDNGELIELCYLGGEWVGGQPCLMFSAVMVDVESQHHVFLVAAL